MFFAYVTICAVYILFNAKFCLLQKSIGSKCGSFVAEFALI